MCDKPMAAPGLTSYRCPNPYGYTMIGARDHADALREARRSDPGARREDLEVWDAGKCRYVPVCSEG